MDRLDNKNTEKFDKLDFCLQKYKGEIIVTLLINQVPLYDYVTQKEAENICKTKEEKNKFQLEAYHFEYFPDQDIEEEELFCYNFPQNLSPVDYKHPMIGFGAYFTYYALVSQHSDLEMFYFNGTEIPEKEFDWIYWDEKKKQICCLCCTCGSLGCANVSMEIKQIKAEPKIFNQAKNTIKWFNFFTFSEYFHEKVSFTFEENQYFEVLQRLKVLNDNLKSYQDYCVFEQERYNNSQSEI
jgi:hypothetical protein